MFGIAELVKVAAFADSLGVEIFGFEKAAAGSLRCEMVGNHLAYNVSLSENGLLSLSASNADGFDSCEYPELIVHQIQPTEWKTIAKIVSALEFSGVTSLVDRPLELVDRFGSVWVIA